MTAKEQSKGRVLAEFGYEVPRVERGYSGQTLYVNVGDGTIAAKPVTDDITLPYFRPAS